MTELTEYAENEFFLRSTVNGSKTGLTQRKHLEQLQKARRVLVPELERSTCPPLALIHLWKWYENELAWNSPISFQEIQAWSKLTKREITAHETEVLFTLDKLYRNSHHG